MKERPGPTTMAEAVEGALASIRERMATRQSMPVLPHGVGIDWVDPDYLIEWDRLQTPMDLIRWVTHLSDKRGATVERLMIFIDVVCDHRGWNSRGV